MKVHINEAQAVWVVSEEELIERGFVLAPDEYKRYRDERVWIHPGWKSPEGFFPTLSHVGSYYHATIGCLQWKIRTRQDLKRFLSRNVHPFCNLRLKQVRVLQEGGVAC
ncbi:hypothetical protein [Arundinibacter roseus]|uniref:Uncharacterized protein n=1 Tax=Arundinibacter roseus TaxID=2070510 RepID=A0A4R4KCH4_9BACT|nr:hypothetical protein [Arundinibacter roseus]TDB64386.1 hypothetical protein EZE20_11930 [Arundinibacter roseus]